MKRKGEKWKRVGIGKKEGRYELVPSSKILSPAGVAEPVQTGPAGAVGHALGVVTELEVHSGTLDEQRGVRRS